jgi:hypothetical protein
MIVECGWRHAEQGEAVVARAPGNMALNATQRGHRQAGGGRWACDTGRVPPISLPSCRGSRRSPASCGPTSWPPANSASGGRQDQVRWAMASWPAQDRMRRGPAHRICVANCTPPQPSSRGRRHGAARRRLQAPTPRRSAFRYGRRGLPCWPEHAELGCPSYWFPIPTLTDCGGRGHSQIGAATCRKIWAAFGPCAERQPASSNASAATGSVAPGGRLSAWPAVYGGPSSSAERGIRTFVTSTRFTRTFRRWA